MVRLKKYLGLLFILFLSSQTSIGQNVESTWEKIKGWPQDFIDKFKQKPELTGNINTLFSYNYINGIPRRDNPFNYQLNASLNLKIGSFNIPFSTNFSNGQFIYNYQLPAIKLPSYNFTGFSPSYKWATLHVGDRNMTFSPYTLSGHSFRGIGTELKPGKFRFAAMYGRLRRAVAEDLNNPNNIDPVYKRKGWGVSVGYEGDSDAIQLILFQAKDDSTSIPHIINDPTIRPMENSIVSLVGKKKLSDKISISGDYAYSAYTRDMTTPYVNEEDINIARRFFGLFQPRVGSTYNLALKTSLDLKVNIGDFSLIHERVEPGYKTLGALFFNDDFENWTVSSKMGMFQNKVMLSTNVGIQRNDLKKTADNSQTRFIGSINLTYSPNDKTNINASYSNFRNTNKIRTSTIPLIQVDSIKLSQINQNANLTWSYIAGEDKNMVYNATFSFQHSNTIQNEEVDNTQTNTNVMGMLTHTYIFTESKIRLMGSVLGNYNILPTATSLSLAPTFSFGIPLLEEKMNITGGTSYVYVDVKETQEIDHLLNMNTDVKYQFHKKHSVGLNMNYVNKISGSTITPSFQEFTGRLNYNWNF